MPPLREVLANLDGYSLWLAAVVAGLTALGWLLRKAVRAIRTGWHRATELARKLDALERVVTRELTTEGSEDTTTKDYARLAAGHATAIEALEQRAIVHDRRLELLELRVGALESSSLEAGV